MPKLTEIEFRVLSPAEQIEYVWLNKCPDVWSAWPFMPMINREYGSNRTGCGLLYAGIAKFGVVHCNLYTVPNTYDEFLDLEFTTYANYKQMADAGWRVD